MRRTLRAAAFAAILVPILCAARGAAAASAPNGIPTGAQSATVRTVVNGDTLRVTLASGAKATVTLLAVDAPDPAAKDPAANCYGVAAKQRVEKLLPAGRTIWLEADATDNDANGRLLRYVWVAKKSGSAYLLNAALVRDGFAVATTSATDRKHADELAAANTAAVAADRGLWTACAAYRAAPTTSAEPAATAPGLTPDEAAYAAAASVIAIDVGNALSDLGNLLQNPTLDSDWFVSVNADLSVIHTEYAELQGLTPPPSLATEHALLLEAMGHYDNAATDVEDFLATLDGAYITDALAELSAGGDALDHATAELDRLKAERGITG